VSKDADRQPLVVVVDLQDRRPVWSMPEWVVERIHEAAGPGAELRVIPFASDGSGDGAARVHPAVIEAVQGATIYMGYGIAPELMDAGGDLRWVHSGAAGVGGSLRGPLIERDVQFTNSAGIHAEPIADTVLGMVLHFTRGFDYAVRAQAQSKWDKEPFYAAGAPLTELAGARIGIVGYGGLGRAVARRFSPLGSKVVALRRRAIPAERDDPATVVWGADGFERILCESDVVVLTAPGTRDTNNLIDASALERMKRGSLVINVARGSLLDESALLAALDRGHIRGAGLDVFGSEPLPTESPLWTHPHVLITPHISAVTHRFWEREADLIATNLQRFQSGEALLNLVDKRAGY